MLTSLMLSMIVYIGMKHTRGNKVKGSNLKRIRGGEKNLTGFRGGEKKYFVRNLILLQIKLQMNS